MLISKQWEGIERNIMIILLINPTMTYLLSFMAPLKLTVSLSTSVSPLPHSLFVPPAAWSASAGLFNIVRLKPDPMVDTQFKFIWLPRKYLSRSYLICRKPIHIILTKKDRSSFLDHSLGLSK